MAIVPVTDIQTLIDRHNQLAIAEAETLASLVTSHPFDTLVGVYPATPSMTSLGMCDCGEPELAVQDSLSLQPAHMCRHCINGMRRYSLRHKRATTEVCIDCNSDEPRKDTHGLIIGPWYHQMMMIEDNVTDTGTTEGLRSKVAAGKVSINDETNQVIIA